MFVVSCLLSAYYTAVYVFTVSDNVCFFSYRLHLPALEAAHPNHHCQLRSRAEQIRLSEAGIVIETWAQAFKNPPMSVVDTSRD